MDLHDSVDHQLRLLGIYRRNLHQLLEQAAQHGGELSAPPAIMNGISEARENIGRITVFLRARNVSIPEDLDDEPPRQRLSPDMQRNDSNLTDTTKHGKAFNRSLHPSQLREVSYNALISYSSLDDPFARQLAEQLTFRGHRLFLMPDALFAEQNTDVQYLANSANQCHTAIVILSDAMIDQMEKHPIRTRRFLSLLRDRTQFVIALYRTESSVQRAEQWRFSKVYGVSTAEAPISVDLVSQTDRDIALHTSSKRRTIGLPFVVIAMTHDEAVELEHPEFLKQWLSPRAVEQFDQLNTALKQYNAEPFAGRYSSSREEWKPFVDNEHTIRDVIEGVVKHMDAIHPSPFGEKRIKAQYYSFDALIERDRSLREMYRDIARIGCIILVDELSLFHPKVMHTYIGSPLFNSPQAALVTVSPFNPYGSIICQVLENELQQQLEDAFTRFAENYDPQCEFSIGDERRLKRWLRNSLPQTLQNWSKPQPNPSRLKEFAQSEGCEYNLDMANGLWSEEGLL